MDFLIERNLPTRYIREMNRGACRVSRCWMSDDASEAGCSAVRLEEPANYGIVYTHTHTHTQRMHSVAAKQMQFQRTVARREARDPRGNKGILHLL